jgi:hypothetical protein
MTGDASLIAICDLVLTQRSKETGRAPTLLVGLYGKSFPQPTDRWQAEHGEHHRQTCGINRVRGPSGGNRHGDSPVMMPKRPS